MTYKDSRGVEYERGPTTLTELRDAINKLIEVYPPAANAEVTLEGNHDRLITLRTEVSVAAGNGASPEFSVDLQKRFLIKLSKKSKPTIVEEEEEYEEDDEDLD